MTKNRLAEETSPYLLQHKDNPVHWWAWGPEALNEAKRTGKPILLSVGYAACHWCHVMAHESFEDEATAEVMNDLFINIKVDREERPDIDAIYMGALHRLGEQGGWPLTMFLAPDARPFFGGTYFPRESRYGRPAFVDVLRSISRTFHDEPEKVTHNADAITADLARHAASDDAALMVSDELLADLTERMVRAVDMKNGGINGAPKFPQWSFFWLMWRGAIRYHDTDARKAVETTLLSICQGGIYDHLGGGFARYSTDERWLVPHFEKMLYDNALLLDLMTEVWRETKNPVFERRISETVVWLEREMTAEGGGFAASLDADSEGEEGRFYIWSRAEITDVLGAEDADHFSGIYDVQEDGNWEGKTILNRLGSLELLSDNEENRLVQMREKLLERRSKRIRPGWDDKVLADWNGLMIAALARASIVFDKPNWLDLAKRAFEFITEKMIVEGRMFHSYRASRAKAMATASDYANMIWAAIRLHEATASKAYLDDAIEMTDVMHRHYWLPDLGRYATTADDVDDVIVRLAAGTDDATPNANAIQVSNLVHLTMLTGEHRYFEQATMIIDSLSGDAGRNLVAHTGLLASAVDILSPQHIVVFAGDDNTAAKQIRRALHSLSLPGAVEQFIAANKTNVVAAHAHEGKSPVDGKATAYACVGPRCSPPQTDPNLLVETLNSNRSARTTS